METLKPYLFYFMHECGVCCYFGLGLFQVVSRIISIPSLQKYKQFTLELLQVNSSIKFCDLSVYPGHHHGIESVMIKV